MNSGKASDDFWNSMLPYEPSRYRNLTLDKLAVVGIQRLLLNGLECTFDNIVVALHRLFPEKFSLISFPQYPDSIRVDNTLRLDCRHSRYVTGNRVKGFALTELGKIAAENTVRLLESAVRIRSTATVPLTGERRNRATRLIREVRDSEGFKKYQTGGSLSRFDVSDVLHGSLDTEDDILRRNLLTLKTYVNMLRLLDEYQELADSVLRFLDFVESHWEEIMSGNRNL